MKPLALGAAGPHPFEENPSRCAGSSGRGRGGGERRGGPQGRPSESRTALSLGFLRERVGGWHLIHENSCEVLLTRTHPPPHTFTVVFSTSVLLSETVQSY